MTIFYITSSCQYLNLTTTLLTMIKAKVLVNSWIIVRISP